MRLVERQRIRTCAILAVWGVALVVLGPVRTLLAGPFHPRIRIDDAVQVEGETIKLSDLLPPDSPGELKEKCSRFILGESPLPSSQRSISGVQIEQLLLDFPATLDQLEIPDRVLITRKRRRLSTNEILNAIETAMPASGTNRGTIPNLGDLHLQAPVFVTKMDAGVEVKSVEFDPVQRKTLFLLWTSKEPQVLPFYVMVKGMARLASTSNSNGSAGGSRGVIHKRTASVKVASPGAALVAAGQPATLIVETPVMRMTMRVTPLERGVKGQLIRVRNQDTLRVLEAEVIGAGLLQAGLGGETGEIAR
jgi:hypothetical protein